MMQRCSAIVLVALSGLSGCAAFMDGWERGIRSQEAQQQELQRAQAEYAQRCAQSGRVIYKSRCLTRYEADQAFYADQAELDRKTRLQAACIARGGRWQEATFSMREGCWGGGTFIVIP